VRARAEWPPRAEVNALADDGDLLDVAADGDAALDDAARIPDACMVLDGVTERHDNSSV
jgi:hypothetical protein